MKLLDAGERSIDAWLLPAGRIARRIARPCDIGALARRELDDAPGGADMQQATFDEDAEDIIRRPGEEAGTTHRDNGKDAAYLDIGLARIIRPIEQHGAGLKIEHAATSCQKAVNAQARPRAEPHRGLAQCQDQPALVGGRDCVIDEDVGLWRERGLGIGALREGCAERAATAPIGF